MFLQMMWLCILWRLYPKCVDIICFSHTTDRVGEHFCTPVLDDFITAWIGMFSHSPKKQSCIGNIKQVEQWHRHIAQLGGGVSGKL